MLHQGCLYLLTDSGELVLELSVMLVVGDSEVGSSRDTRPVSGSWAGAGSPVARAPDRISRTVSGTLPMISLAFSPVDR